MAVRRVGGAEFPGGVGKRGGLARQHAAMVWGNATTGMADRAQSLWVAVERDERVFLGQIDLAFLATVAAHLRRCEKCWETWIDGEVPVDLLTQAIRKIPAWEVFKPLLREARLQMGRGHH